MRSLLIFLITCVISSHTTEDDVSTSEYERKAMIFVNCLRRAMDGGLSAAKFPDYNPLRLRRTVTVPLAIIMGLNGAFSVHDIIVENLVYFQLLNFDTKLTNSTTGAFVSYDYGFIWDAIKISAVWDGVLFNKPFQGTIHLNLLNFTFGGTVVIDQTKTEKWPIYDLTMAANAQQIQVNVRGNEMLDGILGDLIQSGVRIFFQHLSVFNKIGKHYLNKNWVVGSIKYKTVQENCAVIENNSV